MIQETIQRRMNSGNACYHSVQILLPSRLLSKNIKIRIYKTTISPVVLYECETWSLKLREEHRLRVFENRVLRRKFGPRRDDVTGDWMKLLVGKPEGKKPLGRPRRRWVDRIKIDLKEIGWDGMDWVELAQDRDQWRALVNTMMNLRVP
jgi:hypothetical protein